jgi:hypothetical protein
MRNRLKGIYLRFAAFLKHFCPARLMEIKPPFRVGQRRRSASRRVPIIVLCRFLTRYEYDPEQSAARSAPGTGWQPRTTRELGRQPVSDDDDNHGFQGFLVDRTRKKQAAQQAPTRAHDIGRVAQFGGAAPTTRWLSAAWSPDGSQVAVGGTTAGVHSGELGHSGELFVWNGHTGHHEGHSMRHRTHDLAGRVISMSWGAEQHAPGHDRDGQEVRAVGVERQEPGRGEARDQPPRRRRAIAGRLVARRQPARAELTWRPGHAARRPGQRAAAAHPRGPVRPGRLGAGGHRIAGPDGANVAIFDALTGQRERTIAGQEYKATAVSWATRGKVLAVSDGEHIRVLDADSGKRLWNLPWVTAEGDRSEDSTVHYIGWLDSGRYLLEFRKYGGLSRSDSSTKIGTVAVWDITSRSLYWALFHETIGREQRPPAEILLGPQGGRQILMFFDALPAPGLGTHRRPPGMGALSPGWSRRRQRRFRPLSPLKAL